METIIKSLLDSYMSVTLACVIIGYLITTTPYLNKASAFVPVLVTAIGSALAILIHGFGVDTMIYGALAGILSTGLYELLGKGIKNISKFIMSKNPYEDDEEVK